MLERLDRPRFIEVNHRVELSHEPRVEVMAHALGLGQINDPDRALKARRFQGRPQPCFIAQT